MIENKQQTVVEWFADKIDYLIPFVSDEHAKYFNSLIEQAKEMEKQQRSIELPSDEEISKEASVRHYGTNFKHVFASGAKWMRNKIQGGEQ